MAGSPKGRPPWLFLLGSLLILFGLLQLGNLALIWQGNNGALNTPFLTELFSDLPQAEQAAASAAAIAAESTEVSAPVARNIALPAQEHNPRWGRIGARDQLTIIGPTCSPAVQTTLAEVDLRRTEILFKFYPAAPDELDAGLLQQLAYRQGLFAEYWQLLCERQPQNLAEQVALLEQAGMTLTKQRTAMGLHLTSILTELNADIRAVDEAELGELPIFIRNGVVVPTGG